MDPSIFLHLYVCMTCSYTIAGAAALMGKSRLGRLTGTIGFALNLLIFFQIIFSSHRLPIFGNFESVTTITLVLGGLHFLDCFYSGQMDRRFLDIHAKWIFVSILLMLIYLAFFPKTLNQDFYMYDDIRTIVFFHFRILATGFFIYAALIHSAAQYYGFSKYNHLGRNFMLTGVAAFLVSEFSGSLWCLAWFGDSWHWSRGFFKASCLFLAVMVLCHIPPNWNLSKPTRALIGSIPAVGALWILLFH